MKTKLAISNTTWFRIIVALLILAFLGGIALILIFHNNPTIYRVP